jgi:hypothetical protein
MHADDPQSPSSINCEGCGKATPAYDVVSYGSIDGGYRQLCSHCYNAEIARAGGLAHFDNVRFDPVVMTDGAGQAHAFHFRARLLGDKVALDAFEIRDDLPAGYQFQMLGDVEDDLLALLGRLIERMRRRLSVRDLEQTDLGLQIAGQSVRGHIEWDDDTDGLLPLLIIDGQEVSCEQFGRMLMSFEGWQFRLEIRDRSEDV